MPFFHHVFGRTPAVVTSAPGRVEVIGNHTDYNGGLVLGAAIDRHVRAGLRRRADGAIRVASAQQRGLVEADARDLQPLTGEAAWANYVLGVADELLKWGAPIGGFEIAIESTLPTGAGLSSSAALELATALALAATYDLDLDQVTLARLGRQAENAFVGVPCGILDQGVVAFGRAGHLVRIDCREEAFGTVPLPAGTAFWLFRSHQGHALVDGLYAARHAECMAALDVLQRTRPEAPDLCAFTPDEVEAQRDALASEPYRRALHVTQEHQRVQEAVAALEADDVATVGRLLTASHRSSRDLFENSTPELDALVESLDGRAHVYGARLTGGGFGGAVLALTSSGFGSEQAEVIGDAYERRFGVRPEALRCTSADGARVLRAT